MSKLIFFINILVIVIGASLIFYFRSLDYTNGAFLGGFKETLITLGIVGIASLAAGIYFMVTKDYIKMLVSIVGVILVGLFVLGFKS